MERYNFEKYTERHYYEFFSEGPKGTISKLVCFTLSEDDPLPTFNLSFGDRKGTTFEIDDQIVSNNKDGTKILQTVGLIALEFLRTNRNIIITFRGGTPSRNRLYQMFIWKFWNDINQYFSVFGEVNDKWQSFELGTRYDGFVFIYKNKFFEP